MKIFMDTETAYILTEKELRNEFYDLRAEQPETYDYSFECYLRNCLSNNGTLREMDDDAIRGAIFVLAVSGAMGRAREIGKAWKDL